MAIALGSSVGCDSADPVDGAPTLWTAAAEATAEATATERRTGDGALFADPLSATVGTANGAVLRRVVVERATLTDSTEVVDDDAPAFRDVGDDVLLRAMLASFA